MKNLNGKKWISLFFFLTGLILLIATAAIIVGNEAKGNVLGSGRTDISMELTEVHKIGNSLRYDCAGEERLYEAEEGYQIYRITFAVKNSGTEEAYTVDYIADVSGQHFEDVYTVWLEEPYYETAPLFYYDAEPYIPAYRTAGLMHYVQIKEGVEEIQVTYYTDSDYEEQAELAIRIP